MLTMHKPLYFHELSLDKMLKAHDWTYEYSDDHRYWERGRKEMSIINDKIKELGGWSQKIVNKYNKYAPKSIWWTSYCYDNRI